MAAAAPALEVTTLVTLPATAGKQREVVIPAGARNVEHQSTTANTGGDYAIEDTGNDETGDRDDDVAFWYTADGDPKTRKAWYSGAGSLVTTPDASRSIFISGTVASQKVKIRFTGDSA